MTIASLSLCFTLLFYSLVQSEVISDECLSSSKQPHGKLKNHLLCDYDNQIRPKLKKDEATVVKVRMLVMNFEYSMHSYTMTINNWIFLTWNDDHLKWNPSDYDSVKSILLSTDDIWAPNFSLYNGADQGGELNIISSHQCSVDYHGDISCVIPTRHESLCLPNLKRYPFDVQNCTLRFGSWVHEGEEVDYRLLENPISLGHLDKNPEWTLLSANARRDNGKYKCCPNMTFPWLGYNFVIQRHATTVAAMSVIPSIVMAIMTLVTLCLNAEQTDRMTVVCCNLLIHILHVTNIMWQLPDGGLETPLIIVFARDSLILATFTLLTTVLFRQMMKQSNNKPSPMWVSSIVSTILNNKPGQILFLFENNPKEMALVTSGSEEDGKTIIENAENSQHNLNKDWLLFAKILDKLMFCIYLIVYLVMIIAFLP